MGGDTSRVSLSMPVLLKYKILIDQLESVLSQDYTSMNSEIYVFESNTIIQLPTDPNELLKIQTELSNMLTL